MMALRRDATVTEASKLLGKKMKWSVMTGEDLLTCIAGSKLKLFKDAFDSTEDISNVGKRERKNLVMLWRNEKIRHLCLVKFRIEKV
jgi:hypothetical protein